MVASLIGYGAISLGILVVGRKLLGDNFIAGWFCALISAAVVATLKHFEGGF